MEKFKKKEKIKNEKITKKVAKDLVDEITYPIITKMEATANQLGEARYQAMMDGELIANNARRIEEIDEDKNK